MWDELAEFGGVETRVYVHGGLCAVAVDVALGEGVAAEDVVDSLEGGGAVRCVLGEVEGGGENLDTVQLIAVRAPGYE